MKKLNALEITFVSGGIDLASVAFFGSLATISAISFGYIIANSPLPTKEEEEAFYAMQYMNSLNSYESSYSSDSIFINPF